MQLGSLLRSGRRRGPDIWEFRYRDRRHNGRRIYRRIKIGTVNQFKTETSARKGIAGLVREINFGEIRFRTTTMTVAELVEHYRQRELMQDNTWKSYSTKCGYESYLKNWIVPQWGKYKLHEIKTIEVETWLRVCRWRNRAPQRFAISLAFWLTTLAGTIYLTAIRSRSSATVLNAVGFLRSSQSKRRSDCYLSLSSKNARWC